MSGSFRTEELFPKLSHVQRKAGPFSPLGHWCQPARLWGESGGTAQCSEHSLAGEGHTHTGNWLSENSHTIWNKPHSTAPPAGCSQITLYASILSWPVRRLCSSLPTRTAVTAVSSIRFSSESETSVRSSAICRRKERFFLFFLLFYNWNGKNNFDARFDKWCDLMSTTRRTFPSLQQKKKKINV